MLAHTGGVTASTFSFKYLASLLMSLDDGTSLGVIKTLCPHGVSSSKIMKPDINLLWTRTYTVARMLLWRISIHALGFLKIRFNIKETAVSTRACWDMGYLDF